MHHYYLCATESANINKREGRGERDPGTTGSTAEDVAALTPKETSSRVQGMEADKPCVSPKKASEGLEVRPCDGTVYAKSGADDNKRARQRSRPGHALALNSVRHGPWSFHVYTPRHSARCPPGTAKKHSKQFCHPFGHATPLPQEPPLTSQAIFLSTEARDLPRSKTRITRYGKNLPYHNIWQKPSISLETTVLKFSSRARHWQC